MRKTETGVIPSQKALTLRFLRSSAEKFGAKGVIGNLSNQEVKTVASYLEEVKGRSITDKRKSLTSWLAA